MAVLVAVTERLAESASLALIVSPASCACVSVIEPLTICSGPELFDRLTPAGRPLIVMTTFGAEPTPTHAKSFAVRLDSLTF